MISNFEDLERPLMDDSTTTTTDDNCDDEHTTNAAKKHHENEKLLIDDDLQCMDGNAEAYPTSCCCMLPSTQNFGCKEIFCFGSCSFFFLGRKTNLFFRVINAISSMKKSTFSSWSSLKPLKKYVKLIFCINLN